MSMSDVMRPIPFAALMEWILDEHEKYGSIFGVRHSVKYDEKTALPIGRAVFYAYGLCSCNLL